MRTLHTPSRHLAPKVLFVAALFALFAVSSAHAKDAASDAEAQAEADKAYAEALETARGIEQAFVKNARKVRASSVTVLNHRTITRGKRAGEEVIAGGGSGVVVKYGSKKWVLTNVHVIAGAERISIVTFDGVKHTMTVHDQIGRYDIALLAFAPRAKDVPPAVTVKKSASGDKSSGIQEGTWVVATGNPFFLASDGRAVTTLGVISGTDRILPGKYAYVGAIQHDAEVNPGNSGGPLWNLRGDLIGLNGKIATSVQIPGARPTNTGASFALPSHQIVAFLKQLAGKKDAQSGFLGIRTKTVQKKGKPWGAEIISLDRRCPAKTDLQKGDVITHFGKASGARKIYTSSDLQEALSLLQSGTRVKVVAKRGSKTVRWTGRLGAGS